jgi:hypothetical protein
VSTFGSATDHLIEDLLKPAAAGKFFMFVYPPRWERVVNESLDELSARVGVGGRRSRVIDVNAIVNGIIASRFEDLSSAWATDRAAATAYVREHAIEALLEATREADAADGVIFWTRVGGAFPFFRVASVSERLIARLDAPLVVFYPGALEGKAHFALLGKSDGYQYRFDYFYNVTEPIA